MRMFVAVTLPAAVVAELERFLEPRVATGAPWRWTRPETWHVTLAFLGDVDDVERLEDALAGAATRSSALRLRLEGAGAFPGVARTRHLYQRVADVDGRLAPLARHVRTAARRAGTRPDGQPFVPHVTIARTAAPLDATRWLRALETFASAAWLADEFVLYESHLGEGPGGTPRYEPWRRFALGAQPS